jgi:hypothetical protein
MKKYAPTFEEFMNENKELNEKIGSLEGQDLVTYGYDEVKKQKLKGTKPEWNDSNNFFSFTFVNGEGENKEIGYHKDEEIVMYMDSEAKTHKTVTDKKSMRSLVIKDK